ncbi:MAG: lipoyl(octanoyl) transferase LipB [Phycisphaeraceae bacterium]
MTVSTPPKLDVEDLGRMAYAPALAYQRETNAAVIDGRRPPTLLLVEHEPVITITRRPAAAGHLLASREELDRLGIEVQETDRGGDITYHGPGQLVAYPILRLAPLGLNLSSYMRLLEQVVIDTLAQEDVAAFRVERCTGVWAPAVAAAPVGAACDAGPTTRAKICAMGVRIRRNTTMHGLALNVAPNLDHFNTIVPCGIAGHGVTSIAQQRPARPPRMHDVKARLVETMRRSLHQLERGRSVA